jgi:CBS domain-containing protein
MASGDAHLEPSEVTTMRVCDVMTKQVETVRPDTSVREAAGLMRERDIGVLPVCEDDRIVGMITDRDIVVRIVAEGLTDTRVREAMTPDVTCVGEQDDLDEVAGKMRQKQIKRVPVVDANKRLVGIISLGDLAQTDSQLAGEANEGITEGAGDDEGPKEDTQVGSRRATKPQASKEERGMDRSRAHARGGERPGQDQPSTTGTRRKRKG